MSKIILMIICIIILCSFNVYEKASSEELKLLKIERLALKENIKGKAYIYDLTGIKRCNKTKVKFLGVVNTKQGKQYKILTSFFVYSTSEDMCHGSSNIKIYDMSNRYIGLYNVGMPEGLPDTLQDNKLLYLENSKDCNMRKKRIINLNNGLPKSFFMRCTKNGGDIYYFNSGD